MAKKYKIIIVIGLVISFAFIGQGYIDSVKQSMTVRYEAEIKAIVKDVKYIDTSKAKLETIKNDLVEELSNSCEVKGIPNGRQNGATVMDTNGYYSRGKWQFQTKTVQYYYKKLYGKELNVDDAILVAHTEDKARELAYDIIWGEIGGIRNWRNCSRKLNLVTKINLIRAIAKED